MAKVVLMFYEIVGQRFQQVRIGGWIGGPEVIDGIDNAAAQEMEPDSVHLRPCELPTVRNPCRCRREGIDFGVRRHRAEETRPGWVSRARIFHVAFAGEINDLLALKFVLIVAILTPVLQDFVLHLGKYPRPIKVILLGPAIKRVIVTLSALQASAEKELRNGFGSRGAFPGM